jgi:tetratricopeptide (TPR) repeat protein
MNERTPAVYGWGRLADRVVPSYERKREGVRWEAFTALRRSGIVVSVLVGAGMFAPVYAQSPQRRPEEQALRRVVSEKLEIWLSAVRSHSPGRDDQAVERIAPWPRGDLEDVVAEAKPLPFVDAPLLKRAALLHTDIAVLHRTESGYSLPSDGRALAAVNDGSFVGKRAGTFHWRIARRILDLVEPDDDVLLWYRATSAFLQSWREYSELTPHLERARDLFPRDGVLLLYEGSVHAAYAGPRVQNWLQTMSPAGDRGPRPIGDARVELKDAAGRFKKALSLDPSLAEASIRLACVRGLTGHHEQAAADLRRVAERQLSPRLQYLAWLLLGREEMTLGRSPAARHAFAQAATLFPEAQSPRLGLSLLARLAGDREGSREALDVLAETAARGDDPWWTFNERHEPDADELLAQMRRRLAP